MYSPGAPGEPFQTLRTDRRGRAAFLPDAAGEWRVVVDDGTGHRTELTIAVDSEGTAPVAKRAGPAWTYRILVLAAAIALILAAAKRRRRPARA